MPPSLAALDAFLAALPREPLGLFPTPLVRLARLSRRFGIDLWMKRDDCSGVALGGNKTRKLEFIIADARRKGFDTLVTTGPLTSNHTMMTAAAARRAGLNIHCVIGGTPPARYSGNLLLTSYLGASLHFSPLDAANPSPEDEARLERLCDDVATETGGYWIPAGGTMPEAEPGYMGAIAELAHQRGGSFDFDDVVVAYGTGSTTTGILLGLAAGGFEAGVHAVAVETRHAIEDVFRTKAPAELFLETASHFDLGLTSADVPSHRVEYGFAEEGYGVPNAGSDAAMRLMARTEGYFLDTVYTAKAFAGLMGMVQDGRIPQGRRVLFVHTGGLSMTPAGEKQYPTLKADG